MLKKLSISSRRNLQPLKLLQQLLVYSEFMLCLPFPHPSPPPPLSNDAYPKKYYRLCNNRYVYTIAWRVTVCIWHISSYLLQFVELCVCSASENKECVTQLCVFSSFFPVWKRQTDGETMN